MVSQEDRHVRTYLEEARELLAELEEAILELEKDTDNQELVNRVFRAMHTIKGSGAMFGFDEVADFTHNIESVLDQVRNGTIPVSRELTGLILAAGDEIGRMLFPENGKAQSPAVREKLIASFAKFLLPSQDPGAEVESSESGGPNKQKGTPVKDHIYRIRFAPARHVFQFGIDPLAILNELQDLGELEITALTEEIPDLADIKYDECYTSWDLILASKTDINTVKDVFIFVEGDSEILVQEISPAEEQHQRIGEILIERGDVKPGVIDNLTKTQRRLGEILVEKGIVPERKIQSALTEQRVVRQKIDKQATASVRVSSDKLEQLINIVGELVTTQAQLTQFAGSNSHPGLNNAVERMGNLTDELRDCVLQVRMLPIGTTFSKFKRLVRDLSSELGKDVELMTEGDETELDKTIIEKINEPLVHLIRNCLDHGLESPAEREAAGKTSQGLIRLKAMHAAGEVVLSVEDDGRGLDTEALIKKALETGVVTDAKSLSETEIMNLVFHPGLSTADKISDISGRGVGMDVVRREIESLRGSVELQSRRGIGTTATIRLPLTLAIIDGLLIEAGQEQFVIPLHHVKECVELTKNDISKAHGRHIMDFRGNIVPYVRLDEFFGSKNDDSYIEHVIIVENDETATGLVADKIIGEKQAVIKPLGKVFKKAEGLSGATILGDGTVALILDVPQLMRAAEREMNVLH